MKINYSFSTYSLMILSFFSCDKEDEKLINKSVSKDNELNSDATQNSSKQIELYLRGVEIPNEKYFINVKNNNNCQPIQLYFSSSLEDELINTDHILSETEYSDIGEIKSYKQQRSDLEDPILYVYTNEKVDLIHLDGSSYYSCDLPFVGEGAISVHDFNKDLAYIVSSSGEDTLFYEIKNGNVTKISTVEHVLYEYTYDNNPYFGAGIIYDFYSTEFDFQWWFIPEFVPKNNITSIKKYIYADGGMFSPDEVQEYNFIYEYNKEGYPIHLKTEGFTWMKFHYLEK